MDLGEIFCEDMELLDLCSMVGISQNDYTGSADNNVRYFK
jgi:hypothetical protein